MNDPATSALLDRWIRGDADAAEKIYRRYVGRVERYAMKWTKDTLLAEEVAAETMAQGLAGVREGKRPDRLTYWLFGIARNLAVMRYRLSKRESPLPGDLVPGREAGPRTLTLRGELAGVLHRAIEKLPPSCREVVELFGNENLDRGEIAERLGIQRETVDRRFARAYDALREEIRGQITEIVSKSPEGRRRIRWGEVAELRPSFRNVFTTRHLEGRSREETAAALGLPLETVDARLAAAYRQMSCGPDDDFREAREGYRRSL